MSTVNNPQSVKIARKRGAEEPPQKLIVQDNNNGKAAFYVKLGEGQEKRRIISTTKAAEEGAHKAEVAFADETRGKNELARRLFELKRGKQTTTTRKRGRDDVATFVEQKRRRSPPGVDTSARQVEEEQVPQFAERPQKRPSRQPRMKKGQDDEQVEKPQTDEERRQMVELAEYLHQTVFEETKREEPAKKTTEMRPMAKAVKPPKISGHQARQMHRKRVESNKKASQRNGKDTDMSDGDYIYDTYVLAPYDKAFDSRSSALEGHDIGYLIIAPEDRELWETYMDDLPSDDEAQNSDEEDENAEDYYGADYPEDELSEDDEVGKGAYGYRGRGGDESEGEGYESDEGGVWSDDEDDEVERMMNPFKHRSAWRV